MLNLNALSIPGVDLSAGTVTLSLWAAGVVAVLALVLLAAAIFRAPGTHRAHEKCREANEKWMQTQIERKLMEVCEKLRIPAKDLCIVQPASESRTSWKSEIVPDKSDNTSSSTRRLATSRSSAPAQAAR
jgi:hypothetical protein